MQPRRMISFTKMHGLGNDFVVIDATAADFPRAALTESCFQQLADRHRGVGCDQILLLEPAKQAGHDFYYGIYNGDGSPSGQCGNGARCLALFIRRQGLSPKPLLRVGVPHGEITIEHIRDHSADAADFRVNMGTPIFADADIPFQGAAADARGFRRLTLPPALASSPINVQVLSMGNPHVVLTVDDVATAPVLEWGATIERHADFPQRVNVGFMAINHAEAIHLRVFERGAGETLACGSGACAAVVAGIRAGRLAKATPIAVHLPGGTLKIAWSGQADAPVWMEGAATAVFDSQMAINVDAP